MKRFVLLVAICIVYSSLCAQVYAEPVKIGVILPLTGDFAFFGEQAKQGIELAVDEINRSVENVKVIFEDEKCLPKEALNSFKKLTSLDKVDYILGPACTGSIVTVASTANSLKKYMMALLDTNRPVAEAGEYVYSLGYSSEEEAEIVADYMRKQKISKVAVIFEDDSWAVNVKDAFTKKFKSHGGQIVAEESQVVGQGVSAPDYRSVIMRAVKPKPEALYVVPAYNGGYFLRQIRSLGNQLPVFGPDTFAITEVIEIAGEKANGVICANAIVDEESLVAKELKKKLREKFSKEPTSIFYSALGYDGLRILFKAAKAGVPFPRAMSEVAYSDGVIKVQGFDLEGMSELRAGLFQIRDQKISRIIE